MDTKGAGFMLAGVALVIAGCGTPTASSTGTPTVTEDVAVDTSRLVLYEVEGDAAGADITMETPDGTAQATGRAVPIINGQTNTPGLAFGGFEAGDFVYVSAQNTGETGSITCRITVDGEVVSENTSTGAFAIATCKGVAP